MLFYSVLLFLLLPLLRTTFYLWDYYMIINNRAKGKQILTYQNLDFLSNVIADIEAHIALDSRSDQNLEYSVII